MPERKIKVTLPDGKATDAIDVPITESSERWSEITLDDGTILRIKAAVVMVARIDGQFDLEGNPVYFVKSAPTVSVVTVPAHLKKKVQ